MASTLVLTIVSPDSVAAQETSLNTIPVTGAVTERSSIAQIARYIQGIADGAISNTSVTITSIS